MTNIRPLNKCLSDFDDTQLRTYTRFAADIRDQNIEEGSVEEMAFWKTLVELFVAERERREEEVKWLDSLYRLEYDASE